MSDNNNKEKMDIGKRITEYKCDNCGRLVPLRHRMLCQRTGCERTICARCGKDFGEGIFCDYHYNDFKARGVEEWPGNHD